VIGLIRTTRRFVRHGLCVPGTFLRRSCGLDLVLGVPLLIVGALLATDHLRIHRRRPHPPPKQKQPSKLQSWAVQVLHEPRYGLAVLIDAAVGTPGVAH